MGPVVIDVMGFIDRLEYLIIVASFSHRIDKLPSGWLICPTYPLCEKQDSMIEDAMEVLSAVTWAD